MRRSTIAGSHPWYIAWVDLLGILIMQLPTLRLLVSGPSQLSSSQMAVIPP